YLPQIKNHNAQQEFYLTEVIRLAASENKSIHSIEPVFCEEVMGVNDRAELAKLERYYQHKITEKLMQQGVTFRDPARFDLRGELKIGKDVTIDINVIIEGHVTLGDHCTIGANTILRNVSLGNHVEVKSHSVLDGAEIADHCVIGPFARL